MSSVRITSKPIRQGQVIMFAIAGTWFHPRPEDAALPPQCANILRKSRESLGIKRCNSTSSYPTMKVQLGFGASLASPS